MLVILNSTGSMLTSSRHVVSYPSINSSEMIDNSHVGSNFNRLFLKLNRFICNEPPVLSEQSLFLSHTHTHSIGPTKLWAFMHSQLWFDPPFPFCPLDFKMKTRQSYESCIGWGRRKRQGKDDWCLGMPWILKCSCHGKSCISHPRTTFIAIVGPHIYKLSRP